jgi:hypothetical protein
LITVTCKIINELGYYNLICLIQKAVVNDNISIKQKKCSSLKLSSPMRAPILPFKLMIE